MTWSCSRTAKDSFCKYEWYPYVTVATAMNATDSRVRMTYVYRAKGGEQSLARSCQGFISDILRR